MDVPAPEKRLCKRHNRPIQPSRWLAGQRISGCSKCNNERPIYLKNKHKYETSEKGKMMDLRHKAGKKIERNKRSSSWRDNRLTSFELFMRITGLTESQLMFPRR